MTESDMICSDGVLNHIFFWSSKGEVFFFFGFGFGFGFGLANFQIHPARHNFGTLFLNLKLYNITSKENLMGQNTYIDTHSFLKSCPLDGPVSFARQVV